MLVAAGLVALAALRAARSQIQYMYGEIRVSSLPWLTWISRSARDRGDQIDTLGSELSWPVGRTKQEGKWCFLSKVLCH